VLVNRAVAEAGDTTRSQRTAIRANLELPELVADWERVGSTANDGTSLDVTHSGLPSAAGHGWRLAILEGGPESIAERRCEALTLTRASRSGFAVERFCQLERVSSGVVRWTKPTAQTL